MAHTRLDLWVGKFLWSLRPTGLQGCLPSDKKVLTARIAVCVYGILPPGKQQPGASGSSDPVPGTELCPSRGSFEAQPCWARHLEYRPQKQPRWARS